MNNPRSSFSPSEWSHINFSTLVSPFSLHLSVITKVINFIDIFMDTFALSFLVIVQRLVAVPERVFKEYFQNSPLTIHYGGLSPQGQGTCENLDYGRSRSEDCAVHHMVYHVQPAHYYTTYILLSTGTNDFLNGRHGRLIRIPQERN